MAIPNNPAVHIQLEAAKFGDSIGHYAQHVIVTACPNLQVFHIASNLFARPDFPLLLKEIAKKLEAYADNLPGANTLVIPSNSGKLI